MYSQIFVTSILFNSNEMHYLYKCLYFNFFYICIWTIVCNKEFIIIKYNNKYSTMYVYFLLKIYNYSIRCKLYNNTMQYNMSDRIHMFFDRYITSSIASNQRLFRRRETNLLQSQSYLCCFT